MAKEMVVVVASMVGVEMVGRGGGNDDEKMVMVMAKSQRRW